MKLYRLDKDHRYSIGLSDSNPNLYPFNIVIRVHTEGTRKSENISLIARYTKYFRFELLAAYNIAYILNKKMKKRQGNPCL